MVVIGQGCYQARLSTSLVCGSSQNDQPLVPQHSGLCLLVQMVDGCCHKFSLTLLALVVQVVLVWGKLCLVGGST